MASLHSQAGTGYVEIENRIMTALAKTRIPGEAMRIFWTVIRRTYGDGKKESPISLSQFSTSTGLKRPNIVRAIKLLESMNLIIRRVDNHTSVYRINKEYTSWKHLLKKMK